MEPTDRDLEQLAKMAAGVQRDPQTAQGAIDGAYLLGWIAARSGLQNPPPSVVAQFNGSHKPPAKQ